MLRAKPRILTAVFLSTLITGLIIYFIYTREHHNSRSTGPEEELVLKTKELDSIYWINPKAGLILADQVLSLALEAGDSNYIIRTYIKKAGCYQLLDSSDQALLYYSKGLEIANSCANDSLIAKTKNGIANYYLRREEYKEATSYLTEALVASEKVDYKHCTGLIYNGLGLVSISLKDFDKAITYFKKANEICKELNDLPNEAGIYLNIANCYAELKEFEKARQYYLSNLDVLLSLKDTAQIVLAYINLGIVNRNLGNIDEAFNKLENARSLLHSFENQSLLSTTLLEIGTTHFENNNFRAAKRYLQQSLDLSTGTLSKSNSMEALYRLSELEEAEGRPLQALKYYKEYTVLKDSVMNDETRNSVAEIQLKYDIQKKAFENEILHKKYEIKKRQNITLMLVFVFFAIIVVLIVFLIWLSHKNLRKSYKLQELENEYLQDKIIADEKINQLEKLRYQSEIEAKNKELTTVSMQLVTKNKILSDISRMTEEYHQLKTIDPESYKGLQKIIQENLNVDKEWEKFKDLFEKVHQNFFTGLKNNFPELSENELRLCAYLRINLQNKEIARILNVSPATITTSRYRVRKKLQLDNKTVLEDFLRNF